jgi:hypothetical protein
MTKPDKVVGEVAFVAHLGGQSHDPGMLDEAGHALRALAAGLVQIEADVDLGDAEEEPSPLLGEGPGAAGRGDAVEAMGFKHQAVELALADHEAFRLVAEDLLVVQGDAAAGGREHLGTHVVFGVAGQAEGNNRALPVLDGDRDAETVPAEEVAADHVLREAAGLHEVRADAGGQPTVIA